MTDVFSILRKRYPEQEYTLMEEVSDAAGFSRSRSADFMIMNLWPSRGLSLHGIEMKKSRADWLSEMKKPEKAENIFQYCDFFWLLTVGENIAKIEEIPARWGWMEIKGDRILIKKEAPLLTPIPMSRSFLAALLKRAASKDGYVRNSDISERVSSAAQRAKEEAERNSGRLRIKHDEMAKAIGEYKLVTGIDLMNTGWRVSATDIGKAVNFVQSGGSESIVKQLEQLESTTKIILHRITTGIEDLKPKENNHPARE